MAGRKDLFGRMGTTFRSERWLSLDLCGLLGVSLSWGVHFYALIVNGALLISNSVMACSIYFAMYVPVSFLAMASLYRAWTTDPGASLTGDSGSVSKHKKGGKGRNNSNHNGNQNNNGPSQTARPPPPPAHRRGVRRCHKCENNYKPPRAHHDSVTGRCIVKFDHFCPWVGNAVGAMNHKFFCLFLLYTACSCMISLVLLLLRVVHCGYLVDANTKEDVLEDTPVGAYERDEGPSTRRWLEEEDEELRVYRFPECNEFYGNPFVLGLLLASLVFLVFTCTMGCEQIEAIETGKGKIARMKMKVGQAGTEFSRVTEEFNEMFGGTSPRLSWHWLWPEIVKFPKGMQKVVLGYEWDPTFDMDPYESDTNSDRELDEMENGKTVSKVPPPSPSLHDEGDGLVVSPSADDISMSDVSTDDNLPRGMKNRKAASRLDSGEAEGAGGGTLPPIS